MLARIAGAEKCLLAGQNCRLVIRIDTCLHISKDVSIRSRLRSFSIKAISREIQKLLRRVFRYFVTRMLAACVRILLLFAACRDR